jgi:hypothetical protein
MADFRLVVGKRVLLLAVWGLAVWLLLAYGATARADEPVWLEIRLRDAGGAAVAGERVILERLPEEKPMPCVTDDDGACAWRVGRGLYQLIFARPLDQISALALAEGGLRGFGLTVGRADIVYHFTIHSDGRAYFDAAPDEAVPSPLIPAFDALHGGVAPTPILPQMAVASTATPRPAAAPDAADPAPTGQAWPLLAFLGGGLLLGGILHLLWAPSGRGWLRRQQAGGKDGGANDHRMTPRNDQEAPDA